MRVLEIINLGTSLEVITNGLGRVAIAGAVEGVIITSYAGGVIMDGQDAQLSIHSVCGGVWITSSSRDMFSRMGGPQFRK